MVKLASETKQLESDAMKADAVDVFNSSFFASASLFVFVPVRAEYILALAGVCASTKIAD